MTIAFRRWIQSDEEREAASRKLSKMVIPTMTRKRGGYRIVRNLTRQGLAPLSGSNLGLSSNQRFQSISIPVNILCPNKEDG